MVWRAPSSYGFTWEILKRALKKSRVVLRYRLGQLSRIFHAFPISGMHACIDKSMEHGLILHKKGNFPAEHIRHNCNNVL